MGRRPVYVDLDVGQGIISVPGSLGMYFHSWRKVSYTY